MHPLCCLDGSILPLDEARIDPQDRGFLFGDSLYEVVKVMDGRLLHFEAHMDRLLGGLARIEIPAPTALEALSRRLVERAQLASGHLYIQISRGREPRTHIPAIDLQPTVLILPFSHPFAAAGERPLRAVTVPDWRWQHCDIKTTSLMGTVLGKLRARHRVVDEVLFVGEGGRIREGGSTNLFVRTDSSLHTHPTDGSILEGVTRASLLRLAASVSIAVELRAPLLSEIDTWQEAFLCGTTTGVQPLVEIDGRTVGDGSLGELTRSLGQLFEQFEAKLLRDAAEESHQE